ncbi:metalloregulator ArsR/SmtB family transcription factor [soil metagenome]|jgi:ArsR family transcriptional regulator
MNIDMIAIRFDACQYVCVTTTSNAICCPPMLGEPLDESEAIELADILKALADPARLRLISIIASSPDGEACACDLHGPLERSQPTVSHHLSQLTRAGIITREQRGKWAWFRINDQRIAAICDCLSPAGCR